MAAERHATLVYDGDCGICRYWVNYWKQQTGDRVVYRPYQEAAGDFPAIPREHFARAIQLIEPDGTIYAGAAATYRTLRHAPGRAAWWWMYEHIPGFAAVSERAYAFFAQRRGLLSRLSYFLWGAHPEPERYELVSWLFLRLLGGIYVIAFASLAVQIQGLVGERGIRPAAEYLNAAHQGWGVSAYWQMPTLFWLNANDDALFAATGLGILLGLLVVFGIWTRAALIALFVLYLSCVYAGQIFMSYQWDLLLLESGFLAIFLTAGSRIVVWLYRWLIFRYLFMSGIVKALSAQPTWHDLTALKYHFMSQPLPTPLAWYAAQLPPGILAVGTAATLVIELVLVFLIFLPRRLRAFAAWCILIFQTLIILTGNYGFFNLLTIALCVFLFDDAAIRHAIPQKLSLWIQNRAPHPGKAATACALLLTLLVVPVGVDRIFQALALPNLPVVDSITQAISPLLIVNAYGPFATTTTSRPEIIVEGSDDGQNWREYDFRYKPGPIDRAPSWNIPHQPRLDWQMWFAAYGNFAQNPWFERLLRRLLEGSPPVLALLGQNPFPDHPPKHVRALLFDYRFADPATRAKTGQWWIRRQEGLYFPEIKGNQS
ncbi:lipase maturation factor family protein [Hyphomicrobium sp.]|uniref:lipase maturation factor family protein n=1 Tax=Hyphomicrobium sp. TaxID=82 RepID=UPI001E0ED6E5|nr:lipase maturation factor family protein [Hyphomicrobium sp.]MBY0562368.1 lipase maturation factor family protein [Hyphomicrobium sp.]